MMESNQLESLLTNLFDAYRQLDDSTKSIWKKRIQEALAESDSGQVDEQEYKNDAEIHLKEEGKTDCTDTLELEASESSLPAKTEGMVSDEESNANKEGKLPPHQQDFSEKVPLIQNASNSSPTAGGATEVEKSQSAAHPKALPNAIAGQLYEGQILDFKSQENLRFESAGDSVSIEELGLSIQGNTLVGTPLEPGEYRFLVSSSSEARKEFVVLLVNPDPKSLWKNLEPPEDAPYPKDHFEGSHLTLEDEAVRIVAGSMRGRSHAHSATHRDDDFLLTTISPGLYCLAVADGAGSASLSREGSRLACKALEDGLRSDKLRSELSFLERTFGEASAEALANLDEEGQRKLNETMFQVHLQLVQNAIARIQAEVELNPGTSIRDFSTTLLYSIVFKAQNGFVTMNYGIGDGVIAHVKSDRVKLLNTPDGGEFSGQTRFLTMSDSIQDLGNRMTLAFVESLEGLFLMTDGVSDPKFETDSELTNLAIWGELHGELLSEASNVGDEKIEEWMKEWLSFWSPGNHDDRTIIFVHGFNLEL